MHLSKARWFEFIPDGVQERGRITVWEEPDPLYNYVWGADFAYGLSDKDYDAIVVAKRPNNKEEPFVQVAEAHGHWGDTGFVDIVFSLGVWYWNAFGVGERQVGLPALRRLYDEYGYEYLYYNRNLAQRNMRRSDMLGHHKLGQLQSDPIMPSLRKAIRDGKWVIRSKVLLNELRKFRFTPKSTAKDEALRDADLKMDSPSGEFNDLIMALAYANWGMQEVSFFDPPKIRAYAPGTFGELLEHDAVGKKKTGLIDPFESEVRRKEPKNGIRGMFDGFMGRR